MTARSGRGGDGAVVVTGASTGIGRACAVELQKAGMRVFAGVRRTVDADTLLEAVPEGLTPVFLDVTDAGSIEAAVETVRSGLGAGELRGLVNNAGIAIAGPLEFLSPEHLRGQLEVNVVGLAAVTSAFMPLIRRSRGRIVNIGSTGGRLACPLVGAYCASKFAMEGLNDTLRLELKPWGIHVAMVQPGLIDTRMGDKTVKFLEHLPAEGERLYRPLIEVMLKTLDKRLRSAIPPERVAGAVIHALTANRPRVRYLVGADARIFALLLRVLPVRLRDTMLLRFLGVPGTLD